MKTKIDFVTNSSSASFAISKAFLSPDQIDKIKNHIEEGKVINPNIYDTPAWAITEDEHTIRGDTSMDNFDMWWFLQEIGVDEKHVHYCNN